MELQNYFVSVVISLVIGLIGCVLAYKLFDWMTPDVDFAKAVESGNLAVAIFVAGLFIGLGILLGSAVK